MRHSIHAIQISIDPIKQGILNIHIQLQNPITDVRFDVWTGVAWNAAENRMSAGVSCGTDINNSWNSIAVNGTIGFSERTDIFAVRHNISNSCANNNSLYCVEKHPRKRIWVTQNTYPANQVVDASCTMNPDPNKPITGGYGVLRGHSTLRVPGTGNWILLPDTTYYRTDRTTSVFKTDNAGNIEFPLFNQLTASSVSSWTGLNVTGGVLSVSSNCSDWTSTASWATRGSALSTTETFINFVNGQCDTIRPLYCVEF
jgi:hypothetical protein